MAELVGAVDHGTTSTRFMVVDPAGRVVAVHQLEHTQHMPRPGWMEHDPVEIWERTAAVIRTALADAGLVAADLAAIGLTNQRETVVAWDRHTGRPYHPAIVWADTRTDGLVADLVRSGRADEVAAATGLRPSTYFSAPKIRWLLDHVPALADAVDHGDALIGTTDAWLLWNLTGGPDGGIAATDVTNASRTMLMGLASGQWEPELLAAFGLPETMLSQAVLPPIRPSAPVEPFGWTRSDGPLGGAVPVAAILGDQQAALVGQAGFEAGSAKNTYGTGSFLLFNTGLRSVRSTHGLLTTVAHQLGDDPPRYALEGSIAATGAAVAWLRDQLGIITHAADSERLARTVDDNGGVYVVPAFSGLFAPYWRSDARGVIVGLSRHATKAHLARATLEAICYQARDVVEAMHADVGPARQLEVLRVDGGVTANALCMQLQADILGVPVSRPAVAETTALGAAYAAGLAVGVWPSPAAVEATWQEGARWEPTWTADHREAAYAGWRKAVTRSLDWVET